MRIKWKELNRGIVLAVVLAAGLTVSVIIQDAKFEKNIPDIENRMEELGQELAESSIGSGEAVRRKQRAFIMNEYVDRKSKVEDTMATIAKGNMLFMANQPSKENGEVKSGEFRSKRIDVYKAGPNGATVELEYEMKVDMIGTPEIMQFGEMLQTEWYFEDVIGEKDLTKKLTAEHSVVVNGTYTVTLEKSDGVWKIATAGGFSDLSVEGKENGGGMGVG